MDAPSFFSERRIAALVLIACFAIFSIGGILYTGRAIWKWPIGQTTEYLRWERSFIILAVVLTVLGLILLEDLLRAAGDSAISRLGLIAYLVGAVVVVVAETTSLSTHEQVYPQIVFYVVVAFLAQTAFGVSVLRTGLVPNWVGWVTIIWNLAWLVVLPIASPRDVYFPVLHHASPLIIGIALLAE